MSTFHSPCDISYTKLFYIERSCKTIIRTRIFYLLLTFLFSEQLVAQTISSTSGTVCIGCTPSGWSSVQSTDISNGTYWAGNNSYAWANTIPTAPNGHTTWITGFDTEEAYTTMTGLTIGVSYTLQFHLAESQSTAGGTINSSYDGTIRIQLDGFSIATVNYTGGSSTAWITSSVTFTATSTSHEIRFDYNPDPGTNGNFFNISIDASELSAACSAGTSAPILSSTSITNTCPATTVDLTTITASNLPGGTSLTYHTATPATNANKLGTPSAATAGSTYYAAFYDASNDCYSGTNGNGSATTSITSTITACCLAGDEAPQLIKN